MKPINLITVFGAEAVHQSQLPRIRYDIGGSACESNTPSPVGTTAGFEDREDHRIQGASIFFDAEMYCSSRNSI
jgi:hypothetical protein